MSFGRMPIANAFVVPSQFDREYFYELATAFCTGCGSFQIVDQPDPCQMFHEDYAFFTRTSRRMVEHFGGYAEWVRHRFLGADDPFVVEIGCNDGAMLENFAKRGIRHLGIDPSANVAAEAERHGIRTKVAFLNLKLAHEIRDHDGPANAIIAANVICHIPDINEVARSVAHLLADDGVFVFEEPYLGAMIEKGSYDQIYDEHVFIFSVGSVHNAFRPHGLELIDALAQPTHGGSMRYVLAKKGARQVTAGVEQAIAREAAQGLGRAETYEAFRARCERSREALVGLVRRSAVGRPARGRLRRDVQEHDRAQLLRARTAGHRIHQRYDADQATQVHARQPYSGRALRNLCREISPITPSCSPGTTKPKSSKRRRVMRRPAVSGSSLYPKWGSRDPDQQSACAIRGRKAEIDAAVSRVCAAGHYVLGEEVAAFEGEFAAFCGTGYGIGVNSGTDALTLALRGLSISNGDEVITVSHTAVATVAAVIAAGARPVLVDIDPATFTIDPAAIERAVGPKTRAIIPVHLYGLPADMDAIMTIAARHSLKVIEDCAQAAGARCRGRRVGAIGHAGCFSFYPTKNLGAIGDGGMVVTGDSDLAERVRQLRQYGWDAKRESQIDGMNSRLDEIQAAILRVKLPHLDADNRRRTNIARFYDDALAGSELAVPAAPQGREHVYHLYVVRSERRDAALDELRRGGVAAGIHYPVPVHRQPAFRGRGFDAGPLPHSERAAAEVLSLPIYPELAQDQLDTVIAAAGARAALAAAGSRR